MGGRGGTWEEGYIWRRREENMGVWGYVYEWRHNYGGGIVLNTMGGRYIESGAAWGG